MLNVKIKKLYAIDPKSWEHPADKAALSMVQQLKGLDELAKKTYLRGDRAGPCAGGAWPPNVKVERKSVSPAQYAD